jgi:undecaprenyl pyrophosphate synthase
MIMDGNGRWAKRAGLPARSAIAPGSGAEAHRQAAPKLGITC